ncbi:IS66 family insertion sequence element accessory protein TnpB [Intestinibaculum porci]|uniref:IS66 family insertion sequence element accessory protein TnpB n=1 Tax=Intestinibaculum porci TaxID=2487118 RepID=UPI000F637447
MIINAGEIKHIYGSAQYQDMRKQINGLSVLAANCCDMDVMDHSLFIFTNRCNASLFVL